MTVGPTPTVCHDQNGREPWPLAKPVQQASGGESYDTPPSIAGAALALVARRADPARLSRRCGVFPNNRAPGARPRRAAVRALPLVSPPASAHAWPARQRPCRPRGKPGSPAARRCMMHTDTPAYGLWPLVVLNAAVFILFAFSFTHPRSPRDWRSFGAFAGFLVALFTEMYGFPLTIYLLAGWLGRRYPGVDFLSHDAGHLWETLLGWRGDPHLNPLH